MAFITEVNELQALLDACSSTRDWEIEYLALKLGYMNKTYTYPVEALIFFRLLLSNCLNWKIYCDDHSSLSSTTAVQK